MACESSDEGWFLDVFFSLAHCAVFVKERDTIAAVKIKLGEWYGRREKNQKGVMLGHRKEDMFIHSGGVKLPDELRLLDLGIDKESKGPFRLLYDESIYISVYTISGDHIPVAVEPGWQIIHMKEIIQMEKALL